MLVLRTGMGPDKVRAAWDALLKDRACDLIVSSGFAGALVPTSIGALVVSSRVLVFDQGDTRESCIQGETLPPACTRLIKLVSERMGQVPLSGTVVAIKEIVSSAKLKELIADQTQALALDMESGTIGKLAHDRRIPFLVVRTISDLVDENLPSAIQAFSCRATWGRGVLDLVLHPRQVVEIMRLRRQMIIASQQLTNFFRGFCVQGERCL